MSPPAATSTTCPRKPDCPGRRAACAFSVAQLPSCVVAPARDATVRQRAGVIRSRCDSRLSERLPRGPRSEHRGARTDTQRVLPTSRFRSCPSLAQATGALSEGGRPFSLPAHSDKASVLRVNREDHAGSGLTQFGRAMRELRTSGSVGAPGERSPGATRQLVFCALRCRSAQYKVGKKAGARERAKRKVPVLAAQQASEGQVTPLEAEPSAASQTEPQERAPDES
jgi:hypothetical protein